MWRKIGCGVLLAVLVVGPLGLLSCAAVKLPNVAVRAPIEQASPPVLAAFDGDSPVGDAQAWTQRRVPLLARRFAEQVYGAMPAAQMPVVSRQLIASPELADVADIEHWDLAFPALALPDGRTMGVGVTMVIPKGASGPLPVIIGQNFCGNPSAFAKVAKVPEPRGGTPKMCQDSWMQPLVVAIFGKAINEPPFATIAKRGYALAWLYAAEIVPDSSERAQAPLAALTPAGTQADQRTGAIAAWAWTYSRVIDALASDARFDPARLAVWGHSRNGKSALLAAATDPRIWAAIALQPGTAGASLQRNQQGESIAQITQSYPHWFAPAYAQFAGREQDLAVDQHQLLAMIAPRRVLVGTGRRDAWSDPPGSFAAMVGASPAFELFGAAPFAQKDLKDRPGASPLGFYMRGGLHGVHTSDWKTILDWLDKPAVSANTTPPA